MAKKRIQRRRKKSNRKVKENSAHASLCALAPVIADKKVFEPIHENVKIPQKTLLYRPTDKLVFAVVGIISGIETVYDLNQKLRVDRPLLKAFGYRRCADQSVIQETLNASTGENVQQMEASLKTIWDQNNLAVSYLQNAQREKKIVTIDMDMSGQCASRNAEGSTKGYFAGKKNAHGRQLARVLIPDTQEIVTESLYPGNTLPCLVFKAVVAKMEQVLPLETESQRSLVRLRLDGGFGTDENINYALWRGYQLLAKMRSGKRARVLARSVQEWVDVPSSDHASRQAGWVTHPHRYGKKTRQVAVRTPKKKGGYKYSVLVSTDMDADLPEMVTDYDGRGGVPESSFCQDSQGLSNRKRRKRGFVAQQMLTLLNQLAHNMIRWMQNWLIMAVEQTKASPTDDAPDDSTPMEEAGLVIKTLKERGMKRFVRQILLISGQVVMKDQRVLRVVLNPSYPLIKRIMIALRALLKPYEITVSLDET